MDLDQAQTRWTLGKFPYEELPELAAQMMMQGFEGPAILELVSFHKPTLYDIPKGLVDRAFLEAGRARLLLQEAVYRAAEVILLRVAKGSLPPIEGADEIERLCAKHLDYSAYPEPLQRIIATTWEWEDTVEDPGRRRCLELEIIDETQGFLVIRGLL
jgi:hypothetical protein